MARYACVPADALRIVALDDFTAIFHRASGITHLVTAPAPELLEVLDEQPRSVDEIADRLAARFEVEDGETLRVRLAELVAAGLVIAA